jgi:hypothetical protein
MEYLHNIIKSPVVDRELDGFWSDLPAEIQTFSPSDVLVISDTYDAGSAEEIQLHKILQACKLAAGTYNIVKIESASTLPWYKLRDVLQPKTVLLFGVMPQQLGISAMFRLFTPNNFNDCVWVASPSLPELEKQPEAKKQLWQMGLKPIFDNPTENS